MNALVRLIIVAVICSCLNSPAHADRKSREEEKARQQRLELQKQQVESILLQETTGQVTDRKSALKEVLASGEAPDEAYWQAGYIKQGDKWVSVEDRWLTPEQERELGEYTKSRYNFADSDEGQIKLAQWCDEHGFAAHSYAHLKAVLLNKPDHAGLRQMLGYKQIGNRWMNEEEFNAAVRAADRMAEELHTWGPQVVEIRKGLDSGDPRQQNRAKAQLAKITEVAAVSALESILLPSSDLGAAACVDQLCRIDHSRSSIALCNAAMFLPESSSSTKQTAIEELKARPLDDFVPVLLINLETPFSAEFSLYTNSEWEYLDGLTGYYHWREVALGEIAISNQTMSEDRYYRLRTVMRDIGETFTFNRKRKNGLISPLDPTWDNHRLVTDTRREAENLVWIDGYRNLNAAIRVKNERINLINDHITSLLGSLTNQSRNESPEFWWNWWNDRIEVDADAKLTRIVDEEIIGEVFHKVGHKVPGSCFVAGTPVWTDRGPRPIEQLKIGDMALSQDVETGQLAYRPIIRTTTREPKPLVTIDLGAEQLVSTGGHPFFVSGEGWVRARELRAGQILHTPTGSLPIVSVNETPEQETYNLVVDGDHTYFVGMSQVLVHDVSITSPTDAIVPGLLNR